MLHLEAARQQVAALVAEIARHDYQYYVLDAPTISDSEYDGLYRQLIDLEKQFPQLITPDSPTQRICGDGSDVLPILSRVQFLTQYLAQITYSYRCIAFR